MMSLKATPGRKMKNKLIIIGAGGHGRVVADVAMSLNRWEDIVFLDDNPNRKCALF